MNKVINNSWLFNHRRMDWKFPENYLEIRITHGIFEWICHSILSQSWKFNPHSLRNQFIFFCEVNPTKKILVSIRNHPSILQPVVIYVQRSVHVQKSKFVLNILDMISLLPIVVSWFYDRLKLFVKITFVHYFLQLTFVVWNFVYENLVVGTNQSVLVDHYRRYGCRSTDRE